MTEPGCGVEALLARLARLDRRRPVVDRPAVEAALARHFDALGLAPLPVAWVQDAEAGFGHGTRAPAHRGWVAAVTAVEAQGGRLAGEAPWTPARPLAWPACWPEAESVALVVARQQAVAAAGADGPTVAARAREFRTAAAGAIDALTGATRAPAPGGTGETEPPRPSPWLPLVDALVAGLWLYRVTRLEIVAVPRPAVRTDERGRLHALDGPAVLWPGGARYYFWCGRRVPEAAVLRPETLTTETMLAEPNLEVRQIMLERIGLDRLILDLGVRPIHSDACGSLYRFRLPARRGQPALLEPIAVVHVTNATPEPDGRRRAYLLRVPPTMRTAREAVAWTFGLAPEEYGPALET